MLFKKRPVIVEAIQWKGDNLSEIVAMTGLHPFAHKWTWDEYEAVVAKDGLKIWTAEASKVAKVGDWIIKDADGDCDVCDPAVFAETYEPGDGRDGWRNYSSDSTGHHMEMLIAGTWQKMKSPDGITWTPVEICRMPHHTKVTCGGGSIKIGRPGDGREGEG